jgi:hypothetical protein
MQTPSQHQAEIVIEEVLRAIAARADEGGQHEGWPGEGQVLALQRVAATPTSGAQNATLRKQLPPLMRSIWPIQHQFAALVLPWSWCRCCQRAFVKGTYRSRRIVGTNRRPAARVVQECPYADCWGQILRDSRPWASIRQAHPGYPEQPERSVVYAHQPGARS